jgi:hypothetical protein
MRYIGLVLFRECCGEFGFWTLLQLSIKVLDAVRFVDWLRGWAGFCFAVVLILRAKYEAVGANASNKILKYKWAIKHVS